MKDFDAFFRWNASFAFEKENGLSCLFFEGAKSIGEQFSRPKTKELHAEDPTRNSLATANPLRTCHMTLTLSPPIPQLSDNLITAINYTQ